MKQGIFPMSLSLLSIRLLAMPLYKLELFSAALEEKDYSYLLLKINISSRSFLLWASCFYLTRVIYPSCIFGYVLRAVLNCNQTDHLSYIYYPFKKQQTSTTNYKIQVTTSVFPVISICTSANKGWFSYASINQDRLKCIKTIRLNRATYF